MNFINSFIKAMNHEPQISNLANDPLTSWIVPMRWLSFVMIVSVALIFFLKSLRTINKSNLKTKVTNSILIFVLLSTLGYIFIKKAMIDSWQNEETKFRQAYTTCVESDWTDCSEFRSYEGYTYPLTNRTKSDSDSWWNGFFWGLILRWWG